MENKALYIETPGLHIVLGFQNTIVFNKKGLKNIDKLKVGGSLIIGSFFEDGLTTNSVLCEITDIAETNNNSIKVDIEGKKIVEVIDKREEWTIVEYREVFDAYKNENIDEKLMSEFSELFQILNKTQNNLIFENLGNKKIILTCVCSLPLTREVANRILATNSYNKILFLLIETIKFMIAKESIEKEIEEEIKKQLDKEQREYILKRKIEIIKKELNSDNKDENLVENYLEKIGNLPIDESQKDILKKEANKLNKLNEMHAETGVIKNYLDIVLDLPWNNTSNTNLDITKVEKILNKEHYGLEKAKSSVIDYLSFMINNKLHMNNNQSQATILCFVGPPGVGKTSLAKSIANSLDRKFYKIALGGMADESEIRGHRKTYVGAMPGRIIQALRKVKVKNPVILLDEIDKLSKMYNGDPASALLEVLDPEQNKEFTDRYVEIPFDLSSIFFITTANDVSTIPEALYDRMQVIYLDSYTDIDKIEITKKYIVPRMKKNTNVQLNGLTSSKLKYIINSYTKEAGVRQLTRVIEKIYSKVIRKRLELNNEDNIFKYTLKDNDIKEFLGTEIYRIDKLSNTKEKVGNIIGLAWTAYGGVALEVQAVKLKGNGKLILTGKLGDVMKESAEVGYTYIKSKIDKYNLSSKVYTENDIHLHFPEGATPKNGPSAGITITSAILSCLLNKPVRQDIAMTGEITITGYVLPIGGVKEKLIGAINIGAKEVILPIDNKRDVDEIKDEIKEKLLIHYVNHYDEVEKILFN